MNLFQTGNFKLSSGKESWLKIDCDAFTDEDWETIALMIVRKIPTFSKVEYVPTGGRKLAEALEKYVRPFGPILLVDDVWTSGGSMEKARHYRNGVVGAVVFDRTGTTPAWVTALFTLVEGIE